jgi:hypothetical protein
MNSMRSLHDEIVLPPILMQSMQHALDKGTFFSSTSQYGHFLPCPQFPRAHQDESNCTPITSECPMPTFDPRFCSQRPQSCPYSRRRNLEGAHIVYAADVRMQSTNGSRMEFDPRAAAPDGSSPCKGAECSTGDDDYSSDRSSTPSLTGKKTRKIVLTSAQAKDVSKHDPSSIPSNSDPDGIPRAQIFSIRPSMDPPEARATRGRISESARSRTVGAEYGISAKTVRDIWNRITWTAATEPLWTDQVRAVPLFPWFPTLAHPSEHLIVPSAAPV